MTDHVSQLEPGIQDYRLPWVMSKHKPGLMLGTWLIWPYFSPFSAVFSNQQLQLYHGCWICEVLVELCLWKQSSRWISSSAVTFAAVLLWFIDTILFTVWRSLSLSFGFWPLFLLADDVLPWCAIITLETAALDTPNKVAVLVTAAPAKHAPTICPLWKSDKSPILQYFHTNCYKTQFVMHWHWHYTAQTNKRIMKETTNVLPVQPTQTVLFLHCLVFPLFVHLL